MFKLKEDVWLKITQGLLKKRGDRLVVDGLLQSGSCPLCGTKVEDDFVPFKFDREKLVFHTLCCSVQGGCISYVMLTRKIVAEEAIKFLEGFIR